MTWDAMTTSQASTALNRKRRAAELAELASPASGDGAVDVLVIGGGITGAGVALDAASRGLNVVLVEAHDLAFGTSRWSSKLVHGGLRYLATGNVAIARRSAIERGILMTRTAPHLVRALPQLVPLLPSMSTVQRGLVRAGFLGGDALRVAARTPSRVLPRSRRVDARTAVRMSPTVQQEGLGGGLLAYDGQLIDDARLVVAVARTAAQYGARIFTRVGASNVTGTSATLTDALTGASFDVAARAVINAAGVWAGQVDDSITLRPSRGTHLVLDAATFGNPTAALTVPIPGEINRFVFVLPGQLGRVYLGLTDEDAPGEIPDEPQPSAAEIDFLLGAINTALNVPVNRAEVIGSYAGLRPLIDKGKGRTSELSRNHAVSESPAGIISVVGGKLTEYRYMAEDAVDLAVRLRGLAAGPCWTQRLPLVGAPTHRDSAGVGASTGLPESLVARFGSEARRVLAVANCRNPRDRVADQIDVTRAEFEYAVKYEGALDVSDILDRRTRIGLVAADRAAAAAVAAEFVE